MQTVLVIRIEAVVIQIDGNDIRQRQFVHFRQGMFRPMKDKGNQRQRFAEAQRGAGFNQNPFGL